VDKRQIIYSINELRMPGTAGKTLYPARTDRGQKAGSAKKTGFCTSIAVDMQTVFHSCLPGATQFPTKLPVRHGQGDAAACRQDGEVVLAAALACLFFVDQSRVRMTAACFWPACSLVDVQRTRACPRRIASLF
jgi:hypothetical protein